MNLKASLELLQKRLFKLFIFLTPTQLTFHLWPNWAHVYGIRVDYLAPVIYVTDLIIITLFVIWLVVKFSRAQKDDKKVLKKIKREVRRLKNTHKLLMVSLLIFVFFNIGYSIGKETSLIKWIRFFEMFALTVYIIYEKRIRFHEWIVKPLAYSLIFFSIIAFYQFIFQKTTGGFFYFLGERSFSSTTPGIALAMISNRWFLRAYSTFSHPNSLAGFYLVASLILLADSRKSKGNVSLINTALIISLFVLLISFSFGSWIALFILLTMYVIRKRERIFVFVTKLIFWSVLFVSILSPIVFAMFIQDASIYSEKVARRIELAQFSGSMFASKPISGVGLNNFIVNLPNINIFPKKFWYLQPVHNIFLLVLAETGLVGLLTLIVIIDKALRNLLNEKYFEKSKIREKFKLKKHFIILALLAVMLTGSVDHYWITLCQNQLLLSIVLALSYKKNLR